MNRAIWAPVLNHAKNTLSVSEMWVIKGLHQYNCQIVNVKGRRIKLKLTRMYRSEFDKTYIEKMLAPLMPKLRRVITDTLKELDQAGHTQMVRSIETKN